MPKTFRDDPYFSTKRSPPRRSSPQRSPPKPKTKTPPKPPSPKPETPPKTPSPKKAQQQLGWSPTNRIHNFYEDAAYKNHRPFIDKSGVKSLAVLKKYLLDTHPDKTKDLKDKEKLVSDLSFILASTLFTDFKKSKYRD
jgi:hypothetical protein